jgi:hypothetical protein
VAVNNSIKVGPFSFLVINDCNHGEHYETPCIDDDDEEEDGDFNFITFVSSCHIFGL